MPGKAEPALGVLQATAKSMEGSLMPRSSSRSRARRVPWLAAGAGLALAGGTAALVAAIAAAGSFTLRVEKNVHVTNDPTKAFRVSAVNTHEAVAVGPAGFAVYTFQNETTHHIICHKGGGAAKNCWAFWPPVSVSSAKGISKPSAIKGKLGTFRNHGTRQLTLSGHPLYYFTPDLQARNKHRATGD